MAVALDRFDVLTFDCYGTLIDWEAGLLAALHEALPGAAVIEDDILLETYARHEAEAERHESFNYALFDEEETELIGCVYVDPPEKAGADAEISWWVRDEYVGSELEAALDELVPRWIADTWPVRAPRYVGRDLTWQEWLALPDV